MTQQGAQLSRVEALVLLPASLHSARPLFFCYLTNWRDHNLSNFSSSCQIHLEKNAFFPLHLLRRHQEAHVGVAELLIGFVDDDPETGCGAETDWGRGKGSGGLHECRGRPDEAN